MAERMPRLLKIGTLSRFQILLDFDLEIDARYLVELRELITLKFAGQLRRDPNAPQTAPPQPFDVEPIPQDVYWGEDGGNFYGRSTKKGMGLEFYKKWVDRKDEFPRC
jgi:hypothetical protein